MVLLSLGSKKTLFKVKMKRCEMQVFSCPHELNAI